MHMTAKMARAFVSVFASAAIVLACTMPAAPAQAQTQVGSQTESQAGSASSADTAKSSSSKQGSRDDATCTVDLVAVGDCLAHSSVLRANKSGGSYNFNSMFKHVKDDIKAADIAVVNQETVFVGGGYSGYPAFGSPKSLGKALVKAGFDVVTHATNHVMDRGTSAINTTLKFWKKYPKVDVLGIHSSRKDANKIHVVKKNGIKIAMLNYTYGTNGISVPSGKRYMVDMLTDGNKSKIKKDIKRAKKMSDFVIVFPHWGTEYRHSADSFQKKWAKFFANQGVDLVIGAHPHVVEPMKVVKGRKGHKMVCYYSLGNFVSGQDRVARLLGGMAKVRIVKDAKGTRIKSKKIVGLVTHIGSHKSSFSVYKLSDYTSSLAMRNDIHRISGESFSVKKLKSLFKRVSK